MNKEKLKTGVYEILVNLCRTEADGNAEKHIEKIISLCEQHTRNVVLDEAVEALLGVYTHNSYPKHNPRTPAEYDPVQYYPVQKDIVLYMKEVEEAINKLKVEPSLARGD